MFEYQSDGSVVNPLETEFKRDERFMRFLTVKMDKHAISWAERRREKLKVKSFFAQMNLVRIYLIF